MSGQYHAHCKSSLGRGLVGAAFGSGTFWSLVRAQLVQFVVAQRRGRAGARQPRQPRRQWRAVASRGEQGSEQCGAPDFFDGLGQWACQEAAGREKLGSKTPAPAQEVGVSRRRPLARAPCLRGSEFFSPHAMSRSHTNLEKTRGTVTSNYCTPMLGSRVTV